MFEPGGVSLRKDLRYLLPALILFCSWCTCVSPSTRFGGSHANVSLTFQGIVPMAHTFRRRRVPHWQSFVLSDYVAYTTPSGGRCLQHVSIDRHSPEGRRLLARFHSDRPFMPGPTRAFLRPYHHSERQGCRQAIRRWLEREDHDFLAPAPHRHGGTWDWF